MATAIRPIVDVGVDNGPVYLPALNPVHCHPSPSGKHWPRTIENINAQNQHIKTSVCRHCSRIA